MLSQRIVLICADKLKPLLIKLLPIGFLRKVKQLLIKNSYKEVNRLKISSFNPEKFLCGINLIGNIRAEIGLGQSCRLLANVLNLSSINFMIYEYKQVSSIRTSDHDWDQWISKELLYNINLIHINPYELSLAYVKLNSTIWDYKYNIAFWLWELEEFPEEWMDCINYLDEIWTPSEFTSKSIRKITNKPVITIPYYVTAPTDKKYDRNYFDLPNDKFLFMLMYDSNSTMERKNPISAILAYKKAFPIEDSNIGLVIKVNNAQKKDIDILHQLMNGYNNVYYIVDTLQKVQVNSLIECTDVFISLHRAEGFGLVMAEAMLLKTATIATNWSSNTEFMTEESSCLVDFELTYLDHDTGPYKKGSRWAEPKIDDASNYMKKLYLEKEFYNRIVENAYTYITDKLSADRCIKEIENRVNLINRKENNK